MRWLICAGKDTWPPSALVPVAEDGSCDVTHEHYAHGGIIPRLYHFTRSRAGAVSLRCPRSLTVDERERIFEGSEKEAMAKAKEMGAKKKSTKSEESWRQ